MSCSKLKIICFSPTRTTRKVLDAVAEGFDAQEVQIVEVTRVEEVPECHNCGDDDLVIIGAPVYAGRLPVVAVDRFTRIRASAVPAALVVTYGNRAFEDALIELFDLAVDSGLKPVAGAAFIGEHSFSNSETPIAVDRPDHADLEKARDFGKTLAGKLAAGEFSDSDLIDLPGNRPYKELKEPSPVSPITNENCELCGSCERVCPNDAIKVGAMVETDPSKCILCCACVKVCAFGARDMKVPRVLEISRWLAENFSERREPEIYI